MGLRAVQGDIVLVGTAAATGASSGPIANASVISDIAVLIHGDRPSATSLIDTLEREGWVLRRRNPENGRHTHGRVWIKATRSTVDI